MTDPVKKTVLDYVQACLSKISGDFVETWDETEESEQVGNLFYDVFYEFVNRDTWKWDVKAFTPDITTLGPATPTKIKIPDFVSSITQVRYDVGTGGNVDFRAITYMEPQEFLKRYSSSGATRVGVFDAGERYYVSNNAAPMYWTTLDEEHIVFDSFNSEVDGATLDPNKLTLRGKQIPGFTLEDSFVPDIPISAIPLLQAALNAAASEALRQTPSSDDRIKEVRQMSRLSQHNGQVPDRTYYKRKFGRRV